MRKTRYSTNFGSYTSVMLAEAKLHQTDLAAATAKSISYVNHTMTGRSHVSPHWVNLVADVLKLAPQYRETLHRAAAKDAGYEIDLTKET